MTTTAKNTTVEKLKAACERLRGLLSQDAIDDASWAGYEEAASVGFGEEGEYRGRCVEYNILRAWVNFDKQIERFHKIMDQSVSSEDAHPLIFPDHLGE